MTMDKQSEQAVLTIGRTFRKDSLALYAGILVLAIFLVVNHAVATETDSPASEATMEEETSEGLSDDDFLMEEEETTEEGDDDDAVSIVEKMIEEWQEGPGLKFVTKYPNIVQGVSQVILTTDDKRWGKARALAYQDAFVQAMGKFVSSSRQSIGVGLMREYFGDDIPESELRYQEGETPESYVGRIFEKSAVLTERFLDQKLAESGMGTDEIQRLTTPVQKKRKFQESISRRTRTRAFGRAAGLVTVKTFEGMDDEGNSAVGVVAAYLERMRHIANQVAKGKMMRPDPDRAGRSIREQIYSYGRDELVHEFGVRVWWDEQGYPAIVSFGQWGWSPANLNKRKRARRKRFARQQAENDARSNLTVFVNASAEFSGDSNVGAALEEAVNLPRGGGREEPPEDTAIADKLLREAEINAKIELTGYTPVRTWSARHPLLNHQEIVGVVAYWSPAREDAVRKMIGKEAEHEPPRKATKEKPKTRVRGDAQSREPALDDF